MLDGQVWTRIDGHEHVYAAGESFDVSPGVRHQMTNTNTEVATRMLWRVTPALRTETLYGLERDSKTNGVPGLARAAPLLHEHHDEVRPARPLAFL